MNNDAPDVSELRRTLLLIEEYFGNTPPWRQFLGRYPYVSDTLAALATLSPPASPQGVEGLREALGDAFRGHDRMDREALDRWRHIAGKGGHDMAGVNMTTLSRLIATIDALEAALSHPLSGDPI